MRGKVTTAPRSDAASEQDEASLSSIGQALWRGKRSIIVPTLLVTALAIVATNLLTPKYQSESRVLVEGRENVFLRPEAEKSMTDRATVDQETLTSQVQLVLSRDLARDVIKQLKLAELPEFNAALRGSSPLSLLSTIGLVRDPLSMSLDERVLTVYYERLSAYAVDKSRVIVIDFQSHDPELAARVANAIAEKYLTLQQLAKQDQARAAGQWLSGEIEKLRLRVAEAEAKVEEFRSKSNLFIGANNTSLSNQQLTELNAQLSAARAAKTDAETKSRLIREQLRAGRPIEFSEISNSELIRRLSEQRVTLRAQLAEQSSTLLSQHPRIKELRAQIADLDQQVRMEGEKLARSLENDAKVADARVTSLSTYLDQLKRQAASTNEQDVQLRALEREAKAQRDLLESYLAKFREATARDSIAAAPPDARVISRASASNVPYFPKKVPIVLIAAIATLCLSAAFVVTGALLETSPYRKPLRIDDAPVATDEPIIADAPRVASHPRDHLPPAAHLPDPTPHPAEPALHRPDPTPTVSKPAPLVSEPFHPSVPLSPSPPDPQLPVQAAAPAIAPAMPTSSIDELAVAVREAGEAGRRIAVIGAARNIGTTLTTIALARALSHHARVVMIDLAFASPNLDLISDEPGAPGIADLVRGQVSFGEIITRDLASRAHVVAAGRPGSDTPAMIGSPMLVSAFDALSQSYDHLIIDVGSRSEVSLASLLQLTPQAVMVAGDVADNDIAALRDQMHEIGFAEVIVLTGPPPPLDQPAADAAVA